MDYTFIIVVIAVFIIVGILALRNPFLRKMAARNLARRKGNTAIVIVGLLIGTAIITSSFVMGDTMGFVFENAVNQQLGEIDELVHTPGGNQSTNETGLFSYFNQSYYDDLADARGLGQLPSVDGLLPMIFETVPVFNPASQLAEPMANLFGVDPGASQELDALRDLAGNTVDEEEVLSHPGDVIINKRLAESIEAEEGSFVWLYYTIFKFNASNPQQPDVILETEELHVSVIVRNEGKANFLFGSNLYMNIDKAQQLFGKEGQINLIAVSNVGNVETGVELTDSAVAEIESVLQSNGASLLEVEAIKKDSIEATKEASEMMSEVFWLMGSFTIIAGVILVINIFVMLAEERKPEMGISRAIGMKKSHLIQAYIFEGSAYSLVASFLGVFVGLGLAYVMMTALGSIFGQAGLEEILFHFEVDSLIMGFTVGVFITFMTVLLASWFISRLNIVRAIRSIPDPIRTKPSIRFLVFAVFLVVVGILLTLLSLESKSASLFLTGPCLLFFGVAILGTLSGRPRIAYSAGSIAVLLWILFPHNLLETLDMESGMEMFVISGMFLVLAAILLLMVNSSALLKLLTKLMSGRKKTLPVLRVALSYPMKKKFRTGLTLGMFSLIIFTVTVIAMISSFQANSVDSTYRQEAGGYDILGFSNPSTPILDLPQDIPIKPTLANQFDEISSFNLARARMYVKEAGPDASITTNIYGADDSFFEDNDFTFKSIMNGYDSPADVWAAVRADPTLVVLDGSSSMEVGFGPEVIVGLRLGVGEQVIVMTLDGSEEKTVIGILDQTFFFSGMITSDNTVNDHFGFRWPSMYFFTVSDSSTSDAKALAKDLEREFLMNGMQTIVIRELIQNFLNIVSSFMNLFQTYLGLGLVVGIAGLGIITVRNVVERTNEIGVMRAIGYTRKMIRNTFIMEVSFVSILGISVGVLLGVGLSYYIYGDFFGDAGTFLEFFNFIPFANILLIAIITLGFTLLATVSSAFRAARIIPAEALRFKE
ncbi:MAG: FtsX-like permease family protein [Thermoplasmata archaeon]